MKAFSEKDCNEKRIIIKQQQARAHYFCKDCGSLEELDYWLNRAVACNYHVAEIIPSHTEFFASYKLLAWKEIPKARKQKKKQKTKGRWF